MTLKSSKNVRDNFGEIRKSKAEAFTFMQKFPTEYNSNIKIKFE